jgi:hypothetical protein
MKKTFILSLLITATVNCFSQQYQKMTECVIENGVLKNIEIDYNPATGDRSIVVNGVRKDFYSVYPKTGAAYAEEQKWYINNETVTFNGKPYIKYGLPRILSTTEIEKAGSYKSVNVYVESGVTGLAEVIYIPTRQGCEFQPYQLNCGSVVIEESMSYKTTTFFTAKTTGLTGNINYDWKAIDISIVKGQGTATVGVDMESAKKNNDAKLMVTATDSKNCPVSNYQIITVGNPSKSEEPKSLWTSADRKAFMTSCVPSTKMPEAEGKAYCSCMLEKIEKVYLDPATIEKEMKQDVIQKWAQECLQKK